MICEIWYIILFQQQVLISQRRLRKYIKVGIFNLKLSLQKVNKQEMNTFNEMASFLWIKYMYRVVYNYFK